MTQYDDRFRKMSMFKPDGVDARLTSKMRKAPPRHKGEASTKRPPTIFILVLSRIWKVSAILKTAAGDIPASDRFTTRGAADVEAGLRNWRLEQGENLSEQTVVS